MEIVMINEQSIHTNCKVALLKEWATSCMPQEYRTIGRSKLKNEYQMDSLIM